MLLWSALRIGSVVHKTRQCGVPATAFTRKLPVQARSPGHLRLRPRCDLVCAMAKAAQGAVDTPTLDKHDFAQSLDLKALQVEARHCQSIMKKFAGYTLNKPRMRCIVSDGQDKAKRLLLLTDAVRDTDQLPQALKECIMQDKIPVVEYTLHVGYDQMSADEVIRKVVPEDVGEVTHAFESIGHIAHLNLRDALLPYKHIIGQVILDKNPAIKTVVNKVGNIQNEYRVFQMDVVAGQPLLETEVKQHSAKFKLDYSQVYWNSRLETEHKRLVDSFKAGQVVLDVMAGIGPFAVPAAQKGCKVLANDLNPISYKYLEQNITLNKVQRNVTAFNMDGRAFIRQQCNLAEAAAAELQKREGADPAQPLAAPSQSGCPGTSASAATAVAFDHVIMNLPASGIEFLHAFRGAFDRGDWEAQLPLVHCYCFQRKDETQADVRHRVEKALGGSLDSQMSIREVRLVAPNKKMLCLSFHIPPDVAFAAFKADTAEVYKEQQSKRQRTLS